MTVTAAITTQTISATLSDTTISVAVASVPVSVSISEFQVERFNYLVRTKAVDYTLDALADEAVIFTASAIATLPTAIGANGKVYNIKNTGGGIVTILTTLSQTIDGLISISLLQDENITVMSNNSNWIIL